MSSLSRLARKGKGKMGNNSRPVKLVCRSIKNEINDEGECIAYVFQTAEPLTKGVLEFIELCISESGGFLSELKGEFASRVIQEFPIEHKNADPCHITVIQSALCGKLDKELLRDRSFVTRFTKYDNNVYVIFTRKNYCDVLDTLKRDCIVKVIDSDIVSNI